MEAALSRIQADNRYHGVHSKHNDILNRMEEVVLQVRLKINDREIR